MFETGQRLLSEALSELGFDDEHHLTPDSKLAVLNTLPWQRSEVVKLPTTASAAYGVAQVDGLGSLVITPLTTASRSSRTSVKEIRPNVFELRNSQFVVKVTDGAITSLYDINADREVIPKGEKAGQLVIYDDKPLYWQAWDVEVYHLDSRKELPAQKVSISEDTPNRVSLTIETKISDKSWAKTILSLPAVVDDAPTAIEFSAEVEWHETMKFLKVEFPVDIVNTSASYETQFGIVRRPTHFNTTWDMAKFEVCVHKWADLSEATYGVSILNDSRYGFATQGNIMRLSLLRSPKAPDAHADMGHHITRYAIFPHKGGLDERTVRKAAEFNNPMRIVGVHPSTKDHRKGGILSSFTISSAPNLVLDTVKRAEDDEDVSTHDLPVKSGHAVILRLYDALGGKSVGTLTWGDIPVRKVVRVNALEDEVEGENGEGGELVVEEDVFKSGGKEKVKGVKVGVRAFEIVTLKVYLED